MAGACPPAASFSALLFHAHQMAVAVAAAAARLRLGGSAFPCPMSVAAPPGQLRLNGGGGVPSPPPQPPRTGVLVLLPRRHRRARLPGSLRPLSAASGMSMTAIRNMLWLWHLGDVYED